MREAAPWGGGGQRTGEPLSCMFNPSSHSVINIPKHPVDPDSKYNCAGHVDTCGETSVRWYSCGTLALPLPQHAGHILCVSGFNHPFLTDDLLQISLICLTSGNPLQ